MNATEKLGVRIPKRYAMDGTNPSLPKMVSTDDGQWVKVDDLYQMLGDIAAEIGKYHA
jgi:hypothetical protein